MDSKTRDVRHSSSRNGSTETPWVNEFTTSDGEHFAIPFEFVFIEGYLHEGGFAFGRWSEDGYYILDDGDGHEPENMDWLGDKIHFFNSGLLSELLSKHFCP